jgi:hypothetical protein
MISVEFQFLWFVARPTLLAIVIGILSSSAPAGAQYGSAFGIGGGTTPVYQPLCSAHGDLQSHGLRGVPKTETTASDKLVAATAAARQSDTRPIGTQTSPLRRASTFRCLGETRCRLWTRLPCKQRLPAAVAMTAALAALAAT